jgi:hypothetical protein
MDLASLCYRTLIAVVFSLPCTLSPCIFSARAQELTSYSYSIGTISVVDYFIDPISGSDDNSGLSTAAAWRTVQHAWNQIPSSTPLTEGYRFNLMNGSYGTEELPNYWELKRGTQSHPIILRAAQGQSSVKFTRDINMANVSYLYLIGIEITPSPGGDTFHCENCDHILVRGCTLNGSSTTNGAHETVKFNQSQYVYLENNNISNADDNNIDFVAVQYGHIIGNRIHDALDWCAYVKGGSAYIRIESNEVYNCGTGGVTAGQGSGFQFMTSPWLHYEAYDIKLINNIIHNVSGAALGVNGGYNVLIAHNTAYNIGGRSHLLEVVFGERTCDGSSNGAADSSCASYNASGGWGPGAVRQEPDPIGNRNVYVLNNILYNPASVTSPQHFAIYGPRTTSSDSNIPSPQHSDSNLVIKGNLIWNSGSSSVGVEESDQGCQSSNSTCTLALLQAENSINSVEPLLLAPDNGDFRPAANSPLLSVTPAALISFSGGDRQSTSSAPEGVLSNTFSRDFSGATASSARVVGAFNSSSAAISPPTIDDSGTPEDSDPSATLPDISKLTAKAVRKRGKANVSVTATIASSSQISSANASISKGGTTLGSVALLSSDGKYKGSAKVNARRGARLRLRLIASNLGGSVESSKTVKVR